MKRLKNQTSKERNMQNILMQIKNYANDHSLTAEQIKDIFHVGIVVSVKNGTLQLSCYRQDTFA